MTWGWAGGMGTGPAASCKVVGLRRWWGGGEAKMRYIMAVNSRKDLLLVKTTDPLKSKVNQIQLSLNLQRAFFKVTVKICRF